MGLMNAEMGLLVSGVSFVDGDEDGGNPPAEAPEPTQGEGDMEQPAQNSPLSPFGLVSPYVFQEFGSNRPTFGISASAGLTVKLAETIAGRSRSFLSFDFGLDFDGSGIPGQRETENTHRQTVNLRFWNNGHIEIPTDQGPRVILDVEGGLNQHTGINLNADNENGENQPGIGRNNVSDVGGTTGGHEIVSNGANANSSHLVAGAQLTILGESGYFYINGLGGGIADFLGVMRGEVGENFPLYLEGNLGFGVGGLALDLSLNTFAADEVRDRLGRRRPPSTQFTGQANFQVRPDLNLELGVAHIFPSANLLPSVEPRDIQARSLFVYFNAGFENANEIGVQGNIALRRDWEAGEAGEISSEERVFFRLLGSFPIANTPCSWSLQGNVGAPLNQDASLAGDAQLGMNCEF